MGIEDQTTQSYQSIGQPPSAPQLAPSYAPVGAPPPQMMAAIQGLGQFGGAQGMIDQRQAQANPAAFQQWMSEAKAREAQMPGSTMFNTMRQDRQTNQEPRRMDMMARPQPFQQNIAPPWMTQRPQQQDMYKPQFGAMSSSLHQIADQLKQASGGGGQFGRNKYDGTGGPGYDGGMSRGFGQQGAGLMGLGQFGGGSSSSPLMGGSNPYLQSLMGGMVPGSNRNTQEQVAYQKGGEVEHKGPEDLSGIAKYLASKGRNGDSMLIHINPKELKGIQAGLKERGYELTYNPHTGMPEAFLSGLKKLAKKAVKVVTAPVKAVASAVKNTVGPIVTKVRDVVQTGLNAATFGATKSLTSKGAQENFQKIKDKVGPVFTKLRDTVESAAVLAGNYFVPGSSFLTQGLVSKGSQKQLSSGIGQGLMALSGGLAGAGGGLSALKSGFSNVLKNGISGLGASAMSGLKSLGSNALSGLKNLASQGIGAVKNFVSNPIQGLKNLGQKGLAYAKDKLKDFGMDKVTDWVGDKLGGIGEGIGDAFEGAGYALENAGDAIGDAMSGSGEEGASTGTGGGTGTGTGGGGGSNPNDLMKILGSLYAAKHPFEDPREKQGMTNLPKPQFQNTQLKQVPNPNYGKPGEPFFISQEFTPAQAADAPTAAAGGGLMESNGYFIGGGVPNYARGGNVYEYAAGGKLLDGPGDGMSDSIPAEIRGKRVQKALLADGEFVIPADVVSHLGNGSTKAGSKVLYSMMDRVRQARTGNPEQGKQINPNKFVPV